MYFELSFKKKNIITWLLCYLMAFMNSILDSALKVDQSTY